jgi:hypothetical protein
MGKISVELEELFIPQRLQDKAEEGGIWGCKASSDLRKRIDKRLRQFVKLNSLSRTFSEAPKLKRLLGTGNYEKLLDELTEAAKNYTVELSEGLTANAPKRGRPRAPEQQLLYFDVGEVLTVALGKHVKIWQSADPQQQSFGLVICRILAASVGKPLPSCPRGILGKARQVKRL